ncbi:hypothetical protein EAI_02950 [Harpegnathos saltator]|uniref:Uncharacterized protein n=1 Tax=Harpegnathos saltator TaxID=610380 RepID=E2BVN4_HARSA|nr:hypothetical protein EAI_02950 [Harpegnathos saltator]
MEFCSDREDSEVTSIVLITQDRPDYVLRHELDATRLSSPLPLFLPKSPPGTPPPISYSPTSLSPIDDRSPISSPLPWNPSPIASPLTSLLRGGVSYPVYRLEKVEDSMDGTPQNNSNDPLKMDFNKRMEPINKGIEENKTYC